MKRKITKFYIMKLKKAKKENNKQEIERVKNILYQMKI